MLVVLEFLISSMFQLKHIVDVLQKHDLQISVMQASCSVNPVGTNQSNDKLIHWTNSMESPRLVVKSVLENNPVLPSRFALPSKVSILFQTISSSCWYLLVTVFVAIRFLHHNLPDFYEIKN